MIDDHDFRCDLPAFELQSELFLNGGEDRRKIVGRRRVVRPAEIDVEGSSQLGIVVDWPADLLPAEATSS